MDHAGIIAALGGAPSLSVVLGTVPRVVYRWASGRAIPPARWLQFVELARQRGLSGVTMEVLAKGYYPGKHPVRTRAARVRARSRRAKPKPDQETPAAVA